MTKEEFLSKLTHSLGYLPYNEVKRSVDFYREAIEDRMEDGMSEAEAVAAVGSIDEIVHEIEMNLPLSTVVRTRVEDARERAKARSGDRALKIVILAVTSPLWFSLLAAGLSVVLGIVIALFAVVLAFGIAAVALISGGSFTAVMAFVLPYPGIAPRLMLVGMGLVTAAAGLFLLPVTGLVERVVKNCFKYTARVIKRSILRGKEAAA